MEAQEVSVSTVIEGPSTEESLASKPKKSKKWISIVVLVLLLGVGSVLAYHMQNTNPSIPSIAPITFPLTITGTQIYFFPGREKITVQRTIRVSDEGIEERQSMGPSYGTFRSINDGTKYYSLASDGTWTTGPSHGLSALDIHRNPLQRTGIGLPVGDPPDFSLNNPDDWDSNVEFIGLEECAGGVECRVWRWNDPETEDSALLKVDDNGKIMEVRAEWVGCCTVVWIYDYESPVEVAVPTENIRDIP